MNFDLTEEQDMMRGSYARLLDAKCTPERLRAAEKTGIDAEIWAELADLGAFMLRVPEDRDGLGLGTFDAAILMEEVGRTLPSGPIAETILAARLVALLGGDEHAETLADIVGGTSIASLAFADTGQKPKQFVAGGEHAKLVIGKSGTDVLLYQVGQDAFTAEPNLASNGLVEIDLTTCTVFTLASNTEAGQLFDATLEEWKLLTASALAGLGRQAVKMAAEYASERKQFGQFIGQFQAISHPLADNLCDVDGGKLLTWKALRAAADGNAQAAAFCSLALWWNARAAGSAVSQALQTFGGYGLTTEYDIYLYNLRAKAWPLTWGDPAQLLVEAGERFYGGAAPAMPDVGDLPIEFDIGEEAREMIETIDRFMEDNVTAEMRAKFHYSWEGWVPELHKKLAEAGLLFFNPELGGRKIGSYARAAVRRTLEKHGYAHPATSVAEMVGLMIARAGSDELKDEVLSRIISGDIIASLGYSEPAAGSDVFSAQTRATPDGNGWSIEGTKMFTSGANLADYVLMLTRTNSDVAKHKGLTMFIVPLKTEGVTVQPVHTFQDERTNITFYDNVKIPDSYRLGEIDGGTKTMSLALELEHGGSFANAIRANLEAAEELCALIDAPDGGKLIDDPQVRARLARVHASIAISELFEFRASWASVEKKQNLAFGPMAKMFSSERFMDDARDLMDLTAPLSLSKRDGAAQLVNQSYRHAHGTRIYGGTSQVHRSMIAERALGMPRSRA
ncbi:acyl-CoA dehydrogenase [Novosphingopyxis baekryungensis]|uniref:acyl-CoA dehydrogenase n=1 Tax=Novosphingopyxis baekryungensis TaxID=279369 RepID=UPI0003B7A80D|nr:acyl-CoA dehydrogenase [Novosphingopyxis baekryungensis]